MEAVFFTDAAELRGWFEAHHTDAAEQALCFGRIDSVGRRIDDDRYSVRSAVNVAKIAELTAAGLMHPAGLQAFETRWVVSAKRAETRERRLAQVIADSTAGRTVPPLTRR